MDAPAGDGALDGWRVLVAHGGEWGARVELRLRLHGASATVLPTIDIAPPGDLTCLDSVLTGLAQGDYDWLAVTSSAAVLTLSARVATLANRGAHTPATALGAYVGDTQVAAVGPGTSRALARTGVTVAHEPAADRPCCAEALLATFPPPPPPGQGSLGRPPRVLAPRSDLAGPGFAQGLRERGWEVDDVVAYAVGTGQLPAAAVRAEVRDGRYDAVLLGSASTVEDLFELVGTLPADTVVGCVGPMTRQAALDRCVPVHVMPEQSSPEALVDALAAFAGEAPPRSDQNR